MALVVTVLLTVTILVRFPFLRDKISTRLLNYFLSYTDNIAEDIKPVHSCQGQCTFLRLPFRNAELECLYIQEVCRQEKRIGPL